jgi:hypothetical protein
MIPEPTEAMTAFGFGLLVGAALLDQLWRHVRRLERRLAVMRGFDGYYTRADVDAALEQSDAEQGEALHIVFDGPPGHESGRFVECETPDGKSVNAGEWHERSDGLWELRIAHTPQVDKE